MEPLQIPSQLFYKIGQVSRITGVKPHVLRYWEAEFGLVKPRKDRKGQRLYLRRDIDLILQIKDLLHRQHYSIRGAKQKLKQELAPKTSSPDLQIIIEQQKKEVQELLSLLETKEAENMSG